MSEVFENAKKQQQQEDKPRIFTCKKCGSGDVQINRLEKKAKEQSEILAVKLYPSKQADSKWAVKIGKTEVNFGTIGLHDVVTSGDISKFSEYMTRHEGDAKYYGAEQTNLETRAFWVRFLLFESPDFIGNMRAISERMGCEFKYTGATIDKHLKRLQRAGKHWKVAEY